MHTYILGRSREQRGRYAHRSFPFINIFKLGNLTKIDKEQGCIYQSAMAIWGSFQKWQFCIPKVAVLQNGTQGVHE